jgi:DNA-binding Lrp family transcriptional regulator
MKKIKPETPKVDVAAVEASGIKINVPPKGDVQVDLTKVGWRLKDAVRDRLALGMGVVYRFEERDLAKMDVVRARETNSGIDQVMIEMAQNEVQRAERAAREAAFHVIVARRRLAELKHEDHQPKQR